MKRVKNYFLFLIPSVLYLSSCARIDLYEKVVTIPGHSWQSSFKPSFTFTIKDTTAPYQLFLMLRHNEKYNYTNIYINLYVLAPGEDSVQKIQLSLPLATNEGWMGTGMDDIYEHQIPLTPANQKLYFKRAGTYIYTIEQIMREDPLKNVLNVGLRIEKKQ